MPGLDILNAANEGKFAVVVAAAVADKAAAVHCCERIRWAKMPPSSAKSKKESIPLVELITKIGAGRRIVQMPYGRELPRICYWMHEMSVAQSILDTIPGNSPQIKRRQTGLGKNLLRPVQCPQRLSKDAVCLEGGCRWYPFVRRCGFKSGTSCQ